MKYKRNVLIKFKHNIEIVTCVRYGKIYSKCNHSKYKTNITNKRDLSTYTDIFCL